jgi:hypothetical protein
MSRSKRTAWDERLVCDVISLAYDFRSQTGELYFPGGNCCDMSGCVAVFEGIDPKVTAINTYSGDEAETMCRKEGKKWNAFLPSKP